MLSSDSLSLFVFGELSSNYSMIVKIVWLSVVAHVCNPSIMEMKDLVGGGARL